MEAIEKIRPKAVFIDVVMPRHIGYRLKARMEKLDEDERIPVFIFTIDENKDIQIINSCTNEGDVETLVVGINGGARS